MRWEFEGWEEYSHQVAKQPPGGNDCGICTVMFCRLLLMEKPLPQEGSLTPRLMAKMRADFANALIGRTFNGEISLSEDE
jgi:hypothetical protein